MVKIKSASYEYDETYIEIEINKKRSDWDWGYLTTKFHTKGIPLLKLDDITIDISELQYLLQEIENYINGKTEHVLYETLERSMIFILEKYELEKGVIPTRNHISFWRSTHEIGERHLGYGSSYIGLRFAVSIEELNKFVNELKLSAKIYFEDREKESQKNK